MAINTSKAKNYLQEFAFEKLFIEELGWSNPSSGKPVGGKIGGLSFTRKPIAELAGITVFKIISDGLIPESKERAQIHKEISAISHENLLIFVDSQQKHSLWYWVKRENGKNRPRSHLYIKGQPGDLFISKLADLVVELTELDADGNIPVLEVATRLKKALDIETVTKKFYTEFEAEHSRFLGSIEGIADDQERRWYASVLLNRLMFIWFLQKKLFLADGNSEYLIDLLNASSGAKKDTFFTYTLRDLFFEGFAKPLPKRTCVGTVPLGEIPYLNGGLFLPHGIEARIEGDALFTKPFQIIRIPDSAFHDVFSLFKRYSWSLNDTPGGDDREINPDVLGYIFEKYINQKEFGAYYTRPEITEYLCEQTIHQLLLDAANKFAEQAETLSKHGIGKPATQRRYDSISDLLLGADGATCRHLFQTTLPKLSLLDPACGSGAFLVAALKTLLGIATALIGRCEAIGEQQVLNAIATEKKKHRAPLAYWLKKQIITANLYGVDIMEEAVEIAKLRLFLALVSSAETREQLEPLPNIEFNILPGNSLIGLLNVDAAKYDSSTANPNASGIQERMPLVYQPAAGELPMEIESKIAPTEKEKTAAYLAVKRSAKYQELLQRKNELIARYKGIGNWASTNQGAAELRDLTGLREEIDAANRAAREILNKLLVDEFQALGIRYEQATWDAAKAKEGKNQKRALQQTDIEPLQPFHWAYEFDEIMVNRGGFDAIIANPPWEIFKPNAKEFFLRYSKLISRKKMRIEDFEKAKEKLLKDPEINAAWLDYLSGFPHLSQWYRNSDQFANQIGSVNGRKVGSDLNLYKLFIEQSFHLLRDGGRAGIVVPSGIYTDLGAMQLRNLLFDSCRITGLFVFENRKRIFEGVDSRFKFAVLSFIKGEKSDRFPVAFMRHNVSDLNHFPNEDDIRISVPLIKRLSPGSYSIMEFKSPLDIQIAEKMYKYPLLGEQLENTWNVKLTTEFHMTNDSDLFHPEPAKGRIPLYEGKMIWQFQHGYAEPRYWVDEKEGRKRLLGGAQDSGQTLSYQNYRLSYREISSNTNERTLISSFVPSFHFTNHKLMVFVQPVQIKDLLQLATFLNSFCIDHKIRMNVTTSVSMFYVYQLPVPRLTEKDGAYLPLVERAARLVGTAPEYDELIKAVFGPKATHKTHGVRDAQARLTLRAEIDALVARVYGLTEVEFQHILGTFPLVDESVKTQTMNTYRDLLRLGHFSTSTL